MKLSPVLIHTISLVVVLNLKVEAEEYGQIQVHCPVYRYQGIRHIG